MNLKINLTWQGIDAISSRGYTCGYCNRPLASEKGWIGLNQGRICSFIYVCHHCSRPTYFDVSGEQVPGVTFGNPVEEITDETVLQLYDEARKTTGGSCNTATILCCRKILMHIAVDKGAEKDKPFAYYVDYLADKNFVPPDAKDWVNHIREKGNEANQE